MTYWVTLKKAVKYRGAMRQSFSVDGEDTAQAETNTHRELALAGLKMDDTEIASLQPLPYPGEPRLGYKSGDCPSFCMHPAKCAGRHSCPRSISCVD